MRKDSRRLFRRSNSGARKARDCPYAHLRCHVMDCDTASRSPTVYLSRNGPCMKWPAPQNAREIALYHPDYHCRHRPVDKRAQPKHEDFAYPHKPAYRGSISCTRTSSGGCSGGTDAPPSSTCRITSSDLDTTRSASTTPSSKLRKSADNDLEQRRKRPGLPRP
jgi:hypothetical protein